MSMDGWSRWRPHVPAHARRAKAARKVASLAKKGHKAEPVEIEGKTIARTFWGKAWSDNLEAYSDFSNRLPRGRTYVRNGSVIDLTISAGVVKALVAGSEIYEIEITFSPMAMSRWRELVQCAAERIGSLVELLQGRLDKNVMEVLASQKTGLFPSPREIKMKCSCPDWATMCKHVAATLYGVATRLDSRPELIFVLRQVDQSELIRRAGAGIASMGADTPATCPKLETSDLSEIFGIELEDSATPQALTKIPRKDVPAVPAVVTAAPVDPPSPKRRPRARRIPPVTAPSPVDLVDSVDLMMQGVPRSLIQEWVTQGLLAKTARLGWYRVAKRTGRKVLDAALRAYR